MSNFFHIVLLTSIACNKTSHNNIMIMLAKLKGTISVVENLHYSRHPDIMVAYCKHQMKR